MISKSNKELIVGIVLITASLWVVLAGLILFVKLAEMIGVK